MVAMLSRGLVLMIVLGAALAWPYVAYARARRRPAGVFATGLIVAAAIYVVFALFAADWRSVAIELGGVLFFAAIAWGGLRGPSLLAIGWLAHVAWDLLLHPVQFSGQMHGHAPWWYPALCIGFDLFVAGAIVTARRSASRGRVRRYTDGMLAGFVHSEGARTLVLIFHGIGTRLEPLKPLVETIRAELGSDVDVWMPPRWSGLFSNASAVEITRDAVLEVDQLMDAYRFERIIIVGYSAGGIFARKFVVYANGEQEDAPFEAEANAVRHRRAWASKIERVILLAGMNRGWQFAPTVNPFKLMMLRCAYALLRIFPGLQLAASLRRGAPFVADLRNQWLSLSRRGALENLLVVQLLGTIDDVVSPEDNIDTETGSDFVYLDVPGSGHDNVRDFNDKQFGPQRREAFLAAFRDDRETLRARYPPLPSYSVDPNVDHVLFVIHGIRDYGFWTAHLARHVVAAARKQGVSIMPLTPKYGYFAMLPFLIPSTRRAKIRWFMEQYTEALARFPKATRFSYIGHSNGTYLLAGALRDYRTCHFDRVLFAGSVVRSDFFWQRYIDAGRVRAVLNYVADADWVVAIFPRFLATLGADVGGAGWEGFTSKSPSPAEPVNDVEYVGGGHGAALREQHWDDIASFIIGQPALPPPAGRHDSFIGFLARISPLVWLILVAVILLPPLCWISPRPIPKLSWLVPDWSFGGRAFLSFLWLMLMRFILTRV